MKDYAVFMLVVSSVYFGANSADPLILRILYGLVVVLLSAVVLFTKDINSGDER